MHYLNKINEIKPARMHIPFSRVDCTGNELNYVKDVFESGWLTTASKAAEFETKFAQRVKAEYACAVNSCTSALHLALEAIGIKPGDKVLVPTWTFTATAEVVRYLNADPVLLDVDYGTYSLTSDIVAHGISRNPDAKAIIVVHYAGQPAPMVSNSSIGIVDICHQNNLWVIEDAAHAFPAKDCNMAIGSIGDITCFSFYANKTITTGEGGMLTTNNSDIYSRTKLMRLHGINKDVWNRYTSSKSNWEYDITAAGFKYNMPDVNAAIGLAQLERAEAMRLDRQRLAEYYFQNLSSIECIDLPRIRVPFNDHAWHLFPVILNENAKINRNQLIENLANDGIGTSVHYKPLHRMTYYKNKYSLNPSDYPIAEKLWKGCLCLPIYSSLKECEQQYIIERILFHLD